MLYIPKTADYLKIDTDEEVKDFILINLAEYFKSTREKLYPNLSEEKSLKEVAESFYSFRSTPGEVERYIELNEKSKTKKCYDANKFC